MPEIWPDWMGKVIFDGVLLMKGLNYISQYCLESLFVLISSTAPLLLFIWHGINSLKSKGTITHRAHSHDIRFYYKNLGMIQFYHPQNYKESSTKLKNYPSYK